MSRNLYKYIQKLEKRVDDLERSNRLLQNNVDHLETLLRIKDKIPDRPFYPDPISPWYKAPTLEPYKLTCELSHGDDDKSLEDDSFVKLMVDTFDL